MPRNNNILNFPGGANNGALCKLFVVLFYVFLAWMLTQILAFSDGVLGFLVCLGFLYNFGVRQNAFPRMFKQNAVLIVILLLLAMLVFSKTLIPIIVISILYWAMVARQRQEAPYFVQFHMLTGLILNFFIVMSLLILMAAISLVDNLLIVGGVHLGLSQFAQFYGYFVLLALIWGPVIWLSGAALLGRTPYLGLVTQNVRYWT